MRYQTGVPIGSGGMGAVLRAFDPVLGRQVALKILHHDDPELAARMLAEARAQAAVDHPNVASVYEAGYLEDGRPFIAMQLIDGRPLDQVAPAMSLEQRVRLMVTVAEAVHAAHANGLIHRDLKPANILVEESDAGCQPFVLDFGIARLESATGITVTGQVVGTPGYMSPEQASGQVHTLDRRADIFSLGVILYELIGGEHPFRGDSGVEQMLSVLRDEPAPLRRRHPELPADLEAITMCCLEKSPGRRYPTARALADDLLRYLAGEPVRARRVTGIGRAVRLARRHPAVSAVVATAALTVVVAVTLVIVSRVAAGNRERLAQQLGQRVERIQATMRAARLLPRHDISGEKAEVRAEMTVIRGELARLRGSSRGAAHLALGQGHLALGEPAEARNALQAAWADGERSAEQALASARAYAELYRDRLDTARRMRDETARNDAIAAADRELRDACAVENARIRSLGVAVDPMVEGLLDLARGDPAAALDRARRLAADPTAPAEAIAGGAVIAGESLLQRAQELLSAGDFAAHQAAVGEAAEWFGRALEIQRSDPAAALGLCRSRSAATEGMAEAGGTTDEARAAAETACAEALAIDPELWQAHLARGRAAIAVAQLCVRRGEDPGGPAAVARAAAASILAAGGDPCEGQMLDGLALVNLADAARHAHQPAGELLTGAVVRFRAARDADPARPEPFHLLGNALTLVAFQRNAVGEDATAELDEAAVVFAEALDRPGGNARYTLNSLGLVAVELAWMELERGEDPGPRAVEATRALERAIAIAPSYASAWSTLGQAHWALVEYLAATGGDWRAPFAEAERCFNRVLAIDPGRVAGHVNLAGMTASCARAMVRVGEDPSNIVASAIPHLEAQREAAPWDWHVNAAEIDLVVASWETASGRSPDAALDRAARHASELIREAGDDAEGYRLLAEVTRRRVDDMVARGDGFEPLRLRAMAEEGLAQVAAALERNPSLGAAHAHRAVFEEALALAATDPAEAARRRATATAAWQDARRLAPLLDDPAPAAEVSP